jgi:hypothetical protein
MVIVRDYLQKRPWQIFTAMVMLICLLALLVPHSGGHGTLVACVLFFPVFLFGLLDLAMLLRNAVYADESFLPQAPALIPLFQRPPPAFD